MITYVLLAIASMARSICKKKNMSRGDNHTCTNNKMPELKLFLKSNVHYSRGLISFKRLFQNEVYVC